MEAGSPPIELDAQYRVLTEAAAVVDRGERGALAVFGAEAAEYLQSQLTQDVDAIGLGFGAYAGLLDRKGHLVADARVLHRADGTFLLDTEPAAFQQLESHLRTYKVGRDVELEAPDPPFALISVIGPAAGEVVAGSPAGPEGANGTVMLDGAERIAVRTDVGVDLLVPAPEAGAALAAVERQGAERADEAAAEILRVEAGRPRFGAELGPELMPAEAGIVERAISFTKGCYIGQEPVARLHYRGKPNRHLRGVRLEAPAQGGESLHLGEKEVGTLATAVVSPAHGPIALAVVRREAEPGGSVTIGGPDGPAGEIVELPFGGSTRN